MRKKITLFLIIFAGLFLLPDFSLAKACVTDNDCQVVANESKRTIRCIETEPGKKECVRSLEITYPQIPGVPVPTTAASGLPNYVRYIFTLAVVISGFIILGALIHSGFLYLTSTGIPEQLKKARKGILSGLLGGLILLSSVLVFNIINPQLTILELEDIKPLEQVVIPGVYICNYKPDGMTITVDGQDIVVDLNDVLNKYINSAGLAGPAVEEQKKAAGILKAIMKLNDNQVCPRINFSTKFEDFQVTANKTIFIVPSISINPDTGQRQVKYEYGIVLHEKDNFGGQCDYFPKETLSPDNPNVKLIYNHQIAGFSAQGLGFNASSVTLFRKPSFEPVGEGVTLFRYFNYNRDEPTATPKGDQKSYKPVGDGDIIRVDASEISSAGLAENARSISFNPDGAYLALLFEGGGSNPFTKRCKVLSKDNPDIMDTPIGLCGPGCQNWFLRITYGYFWGTPGMPTNQRCAPCLNSMIVIKGSQL